LYFGIHNLWIELSGVEAGTTSKLSPECGLARGNPQWPGVLDLFRNPKISRFNFLVDLKAQSTQCGGQSTVQMFKTFVELKNG
jgi:hypothetical protein